MELEQVWTIEENINHQINLYPIVDKIKKKMKIKLKLVLENKNLFKVKIQYLIIINIYYRIK